MDKEEYEAFINYANFTAKFQLGDEVIVTKGHMQAEDGSIVTPDSSTRPTRISFYSP
jgi:hypothetical protein